MEVEQMDKISGIVPSSRRVSSVDLKNAPPIRPGTPSFGRPQGVSTLTEQNKPTTAQLAIAAQKEVSDKRTLNERAPVFIQDMADKFFMQKKKEAGPVEDFDLNIGWKAPATRTQEGLDAAADAEFAAITAPSRGMATPVEKRGTEASQMAAQSIPADEREFTPPGSYLDVVA